MAYVTVEELREALENAGGAGARTAGSLPDSRLEAHLTEATARVSARLSASYTLPDAGDDPTVVPDGTPALLRSVIIGVAAYFATLEFFGSQPLEERDPTVLRYAAARELLADLAAGRAVDPDLPPSGGTAPSGEAAIFQGGPSTGLASGWLEDVYAGRHNAPPHAGGVTWE